MNTGSKSGASKSGRVRRDVPFLEQTAGVGWGRSFEFSRKKLSIGRTADNEIVLDSTSVSRVHAVIKLTAKGWFIEDNISKNGIWVNGIAVKKALLRPGDVIQIGEFVFRFCDPTVMAPAKAESSRGTVGKTEVLSTDTWNVVPETNPPKPPIEAGRSRGSISAASEQAPRVPPVRPRPKTHGPKEPIKLVSFGKGNQERLYLAIGLVGGLLVGCLLYLRLQKIVAPPVPILATESAKVEREAPVPPQEAFRKIADSVEEARQQKVESKESAQAKIIRKASEETKRAGIRPEDMQLSHKGKKQRVASKDIEVYLSEGKNYLQDGDFESAVLAFRFALVIDPDSAAAKAGLVAAQKHDSSKSKTETKVEKTSDKTSEKAEKKASVSKLLKSAADSLKKRRYQEAIEFAEKARLIEIPGETAYLNEAKQIIDRSGRRQKEGFDPFIELARKKMSEGDYRGSILLCEEMLRTDPGYAPAKECMERSTAGMAVAVPSGSKSGDTK